ncbi:MAG: hypothetical protein K2W82_17055 [Candidatus Obscuribacterales bacterium]|nr:hypothetical protein [Candidatus Obscuribacterales bacterium]
MKFIQVPLNEDDLVIHATLVGGKVVCHSKIHRLSETVWRLFWIETTGDKRSHGYGSAHLKNLIDQIKNLDSKARGFAFEIPSRHFDRLEEKLETDEQLERQRRGLFYERLGAKLWDGHNNPYPNNQLQKVELMWFQLSDTLIGQSDIEVMLAYLKQTHPYWFSN